MQPQYVSQHKRNFQLNIRMTSLHVASSCIYSYVYCRPGLYTVYSWSLGEDRMFYSDLEECSIQRIILTRFSTWNYHYIEFYILSPNSISNELFLYLFFLLYCITTTTKVTNKMLIPFFRMID